jgi:hypothetical protein
MKKKTLLYLVLAGMLLVSTQAYADVFDFEAAGRLGVILIMVTLIICG